MQLKWSAAFSEINKSVMVSKDASYIAWVSQGFMISHIIGRAKHKI